MSSTREALVIGINYYPPSTTLDKLTAAVKDANEIATLLEHYGYESFRVQRLPQELNQKGESLAKAEESAVKASDLKTAIENLFNPPAPNESPELGLFYFSGHGWRKTVNGKQEVFLATSDVFIDEDLSPDEQEYGVSLRWLSEQLASSPIQKIIVWLDCCFSGELFKYLDQIPLKKDICLIAATRSFEPGQEIPHEQGLFTKFLSKGITPEYSPDGIVDSHKLAQYIKSEMAQTSQAPQIANSDKTILLTSKVRKKAFQDECPYRSLDFFTESPEDAMVFYGRTKLVRELIKRVIEKHRLIGVLGHSGSGKSSLLRAGLLYQLKLGQLIPGSNNWHYLEPFTPTNKPSQQLFKALAKKIKRNADHNDDTPIILIIDQFEECFTLSNEANVNAFIEKLQTLLLDLPNLQILLGMRSDFRKEWRNYPQFKEQINVFNVEQLNSEEIREAIEKPAKWVGLEIESELKQKLISDVEDYPESLPLLQYTLTELWKKSRKQGEKFLRLQTYKTLGGIEGTLEKRADEVFNSLSKKNKQVAKRIFLELSSSICGTRRRVYLANLKNSHHSYAELNDVANILAHKDNRLISRTVENSLHEDTQNDNHGRVILDVVHEALIRNWRKLEKWQTEYHNGMIAERKIEADAQEWLNSEKNSDYLLQGARLNVAEDYLKNYGKWCMLDGIAEKFIEESRKLKTKQEQEQKQEQENREQDKLENTVAKERAEAAEQREKDQRKVNKKLRFLSTIAIFNALFAALLGISSLVKSEESKLKERAARITVKLSVSNQIEHLLESIELVDNNQKFHKRWLKPSTKLMPEVQSVLYQAVEDSRERFSFNNHRDRVNSASFSPDGKYLVSASGSKDKTIKDNTVRLWDVEKQSLIHTFKGHQDIVRSVKFSLDSKYLVSGSDDKTVKLWDVSTKSLINTFEGEDGHQDIVISVAFSPDGKYIVSGSKDKTIKLWDISKQSLIHTFNGYQGHQDMVRSVEFSPDGNYLVSGSYDQTVKLWDVENKSLVHTYKDHQGRVNSVGFSPDGKYIVSGGDDKTVRLWIVSAVNFNTVRLWDIKEKTLFFTFNGHDSSIKSVAFSPDGKSIVSGSWDQTVKLWDVSSTSLIHTFNGHQESVFSVEFSPDGKSIVSGSWDKTVKLWDVSSSSPIYTYKDHQDSNNKNRDQILSVSFSPDGKYFVSGGEDNTVKLWDVMDKSLIYTFNGHQNSFFSVGFSPDGKSIVSGGEDNTVKLWNVSKQSLIHTFNGKDGHQDQVTSVGFSPDGKYLVSGSQDKTVNLWDVENKSLIHTFEGKDGHQDRVTSVGFSPDGKYLVSGSQDKMVNLWDVENKSLIHTFEGHQSWVTSVGFSPDGKYLVSGSKDKTVKLWDISTQSLVHTFKGHQDTVLSVGYSSDGKYILSASDNKMMKSLQGEEGWQDWLEVGCERINAHPILESKEIPSASEAAKTCKRLKS